MFDKNQTHQHKRLIPTVKHRSEGVVNWTWFENAVPEFTINSSVYQSVLVKCKAICPTAKAWLNLGNAHIKPSSKSTTVSYYTSYNNLKQMNHWVFLGFLTLLQHVGLVVVK